MGKKAAFRGSITALVTPFRAGKFDEAGISGASSIGRSPTAPMGSFRSARPARARRLSHAEHRQVVEICVAEAKGRVPVIAGAGSNNTDEAIDLAVHAEKAGADGLLVVTPYYNKPSQEGMYRHFKAINDAVGIPIIIYNIPPRSVVDLSIETMQRLFELKNIAGVKDATGNLARTALQRQALGPDFIQFSGEDMTALGGDGAWRRTAAFR